MPGGPGAPGAANADPNATRQVPRGPVRPSTPPGGMRGPVPPGRPPAPGGPRRPGEEPTDLLPPVHQTVAREPELLTHREDEVELEAYDDYEYEDEAPTEEEAKALRRRKIWRRVRRIAYVGVFLMILGPIVAFAIAYQVVSVPNPEEVAFGQDKAITILYSDESVMTRIAKDEANRTMIKYDDLPDTVKKAVYAAEDPTFETNPGFDFRAIARAVWYQATGRDSGGSGLTQQYVKKATDEADETLTRKFTEVVRAYKMSEQQEKPDILTAYLNTIYFGRSAYGVKEAGQVYFGKELKDLTPSEAALIAGMIQNPSRSEKPEYVKERWEYVTKQMVSLGWMDQAYRDAQTVPQIRPFSEIEQHGLDGPRLLIRLQVEAELAKFKWPLDRAKKVGVTVHTTIDPKMQTAAEEAVAEIMEGQPEELRTSMSAIEPGTGAVRAYWGGDGNGIDYQLGTLQEPGSSFKPFDFVAALQKGEGAGKLYDGSSPRTFPGRGPDRPVRNSPGVACAVPKHCSVREAMVKSVNTVFFDMAIQLGTGKVAEAAHQAGVPREVQLEGKPRKLLVSEDGGAPDGNISIGGGQTLVRPFDMTSAYATFAARGVYHEPYFVSKITNAEGETLYTHADVTNPAFDSDPQKSQDIADNVTDVLKEIPKSSKIPCAGGRECAGKTGTHELADTTENAKAWMVGYTPSLAAGVWLGTDAGNIALRNRDGAIYGSGVPGRIWQRFMDKALDGAPMDRFPKPKPIGQLEAPPITTTNPTTTTTPKEEEPQAPTSTTKTPPRDNTTTPTTTTPPRCPGLRCPTNTTDPTEKPDPDPIGGGSPPTR
ncbi:transglycosylase domain-containing protein [Saccharothrix obliqua]|uniref:transglycosylase domain-containing protein n=1 Tax=Saccharothrix obliqua TaxID=2861747 RepID=UPI0027E2D10F|nr:transglycosylase domain-containing protein [Saccharothrix obliqua]